MTEEQKSYIVGNNKSVKTMKQLFTDQFDEMLPAIISIFMIAIVYYFIKWLNCKRKRGKGNWKDKEWKEKKSAGIEKEMEYRN